MSCKMLIIDGIRIREEDAKARGLIGERKIPAGPRAQSAKQDEGAKEAPSETPAKPANKARRAASK